MKKAKLEVKKTVNFGSEVAPLYDTVSYSIEAVAGDVLCGTHAMDIWNFLHSYVRGGGTGNAVTLQIDGKVIPYTGIKEKLSELYSFASNTDYQLVME